MSPVAIVLLVLGGLGVLGFSGCIVCVALLPPVESSATGGETKPRKVSVEDYMGTWTAKGVLFTMTRGKGLDGKESVSVNYKRDGSVAATRTTVEKSGRFKELDGNDVVVGVAFVTTTIEVQVPPHEQGGIWKMTVEGDELTLQSAPSTGTATPASP